MRTRNMHDAAGIYTGFEVSNTLFTRRRACRIARDVSGAIVTRWPRRFAWSDDDFCAFNVDDVPFLIIEPFGDNGCYWIVAETPSTDTAPQTHRVRDAFERAWGWPLYRAG